MGTDLHCQTQTLVSRPGSLPFHSPVSQKSTSILDPSASRSGSSSRSIPGYHLDSPQRPSPPEPRLGGRSLTVSCETLMMGRVSSEAQSLF